MHLYFNVSLTRYQLCYSSVLNISLKILLDLFSISSPILFPTSVRTFFYIHIRHIALLITSDFNCSNLGLQTVNHERKLLASMSEISSHPQQPSRHTPGLEPERRSLLHRTACFNCRASRQKCDRQNPWYV